MAYQMAATVVTLNDLEGHSSVAGLFKCNPSNISAAFYTISTGSVLARFLCISRASCSVSVCDCPWAHLSNRWFSRNFLCRSPVAVAWSCSGGVAIRYVLPVLWMTSRLTVVGQVGRSTATSGVATLGRSLSMNALF